MNKINISHNAINFFAYTQSPEKKNTSHSMKQYAKIKRNNVA